jgi:predicted DNA-binding transcriptional regulator AlpA
MIDEELLSVKQVAAKLGRPDSYVYAMIRRGFRMVAGRTTMTAVLRWLAIPKNEKPRSRIR